MNARAITQALGGRWHGRYGTALCSAHDNRRTPALSLADGEGGRLLVYCHAGCTGADVLAALRARGLLPGAAGGWQTDPLEATRRRAERQADEARRVAQARRCWDEAGPVAGTLGERYIRARGIRCAIPPTLRFHAACWHGPTARRLPALVGAVAVGRKLVGAHRTFIAEPGEKIADNAKLMLGRCAGGAVRLSGGAGPLVVAEGIETAASLLEALRGHAPRVWAALSTAGMAGLILPREPGELVIAPDGDAPGAEAAEKLANRAWAAGWRVRVMDCPPGLDWNDLAREAVA